VFLFLEHVSMVKCFFIWKYIKTVFLHFFIFWNLFFTRDQYCYVPSLFLHCFNGLTSRTYNCHQTIYKESSNSSMNCYLLAQRLAAKMSILEISTALFPTLTLVWKYWQLSLQLRRLGGQGQIKWRLILPCWCWKRKTF
jgi:hypothetical protein